MNLYIGTKMIKARPMARLEYNSYREWPMPENEEGTDPGYLVEYLNGGEPNHPDHAGYISWSPASVFEATYQSVSDGSEAPRVTPEHIEDVIASTHYFRLTDRLTVCVLELRNGFVVTGESSCVDPENFDKEKGEVIARGNAVEKIWPLEGYLLRQRLYDIGRFTQ